MASVIRQMDRFFSLPILFLSASTDKNVQQDALRLGGDDFLIKPIKKSRLISSVTVRIDRYHTLRQLMVRDGLTGLFNHTMLKERLFQEMMRAARQKTPLSYAMLDLDYFKKVNDTYGHATGDNVLRSTTRFLTQRLRTTDIVGRYGGEEFAVILPDTSGAQALEVMEEILESFSRVRHHGGEEEFSVTLSCGIASFSEFSKPAEISDAADITLYEAKRSGRNRVFLAGGKTP